MYIKIFALTFVIWILNSFNECVESKNSTREALVLNNIVSSVLLGQKDIIIEGSSQLIFILKCEYKKPVVWKCLKYDNSKQSPYTPQDYYFKFGILLIIWGLKSFKENACFCFKNSNGEVRSMFNELVSPFQVQTLENIHIVPEGDSFYMQCTIINAKDYQNILNITWILPEGLQWDERMEQSLDLNQHLNSLSVGNAEINDSGDYTCQVSYNLLNEEPKVIRQINSSYNMEIMNQENFTNALVDVPYFKDFNFKANQTANMGVRFHYHQSENTQWFLPNGTKIVPNQKYHIENDFYYSILHIRDARLWDSGNYVVSVKLFFGNRKQELALTIEDVPIVQMKDVLAYANESVSVQCTVQSHPEASVSWTFESCSNWHWCSLQPMEIFGNLNISEGNTDLELIYTLTFETNTSGIMRCKAVNTFGTAVAESQVILRDNNANMTIYGVNDDDVIKLGDSVTITCTAFVYYFSDDINWYDPNKRLVNETENIAIKSSLSSYYYIKSLTFKEIKDSDQGQYECQARLRNSSNTNSLKKIIIVKALKSVTPGFGATWIVGLSVVLAILISLLIYVYVRSQSERKLLYELKAAGLANFEDGNLGLINPASTMDEQADLLPYDRRFEFPRDKLKLDIQLGAGAFGTVFKAYAQGIKPDEDESVVAVKMVKCDANNEIIKALVSELKIMIYIGRHLNVVNLLGAVSKNVVKRELMVIFEYCHYGNIRDFLIRHRKRFVNQIDTNIEEIATLHQNSGYLSTLDTFGSSMSNSAFDATQSEEKIALETLKEDDDGISLSEYYVKQDLENEKSVTTADLVCWSFQLAGGMEYLSSMNVLHGDLAARNILLSEGYIVKICDFGLARSLYKSDNYKKQGDALLPIKWLALESLSDHVFSTYTDVWSFGIVLWELFSLATVPYPDIHSYQDLYRMLKNGYRMEKPPFANDDIYSIMLECWHKNPESRPLFHTLKEKFAKLLGEEIAAMPI